MLKDPLLWLTFVYPPNELLEPDFWCNRAELTFDERFPELEYFPDERYFAIAITSSLGIKSVGVALGCDAGKIDFGNALLPAIRRTALFADVLRVTNT